MEHVKVELTPSPVAPGQLKHHYMPDIPLILASAEVSDTEITNITSCEDMENIVLATDATIAARELYQKLRNKNKNAKYLLLKLPLEVFSDEKWEGILNRLEKAATYNLIKK
jgi:hypothetical protein